VAEGFTVDLMFESAVVAIAALLLALRHLPAILAIPVTLLRVGMVTVYFAEFFDGSWCMNDDRGYFNESINLLNSYGYDPITAFLTPDGHQTLAAVAGGHHYLYYWVNMTAIYLFGEHYWAAVLVNVLMTFVAGYLLGRIVEMLGFSRSYCSCLVLFYLLHWDVITWSSFVNLKDTLVQMLSVAGFYFIVRFIQNRDWLSVAGFAATLQFFFWIRFYVPVLILVATVLWALWQWQDMRKYLLIPIAVAATFFALRGAGDATDMVSPSGWAYGMCVILLAPLPWTLIDDVYYFMFPAAALHTLFLLPGAIGSWQLWRANRTGRLFVIYMVVVLSLYAMAEDIRGNRQRSQLSFIFAWVQFQFLWSFLPARAAKALPAAQIVLRPHVPAAARPRIAHT
jgi:hypothetical protein